MGGKNLEGDMMQVWLYDRPLAKKLIRLRNFIEKEIKIPGEAGHVFSVHQEQILRNMALIFDKQISRERNICPVAQEFAMALLKCRPEYLSTETCKLLAEDTVTLNMIIPQFFLTEML